MPDLERRQFPSPSNEPTSKLVVFNFHEIPLPDLPSEIERWLSRTDLRVTACHSVLHSELLLIFGQTRQSGDPKTKFKLFNPGYLGHPYLPYEINNWSKKSPKKIVGTVSPYSSSYTMIFYEDATPEGASSVEWLNTNDIGRPSVPRYVEDWLERERTFVRATAVPRETCFVIHFHDKAELGRETKVKFFNYNEVGLGPGLPRAVESWLNRSGVHITASAVPWSTSYIALFYEAGDPSLPKTKLKTFNWGEVGMPNLAGEIAHWLANSKAKVVCTATPEESHSSLVMLFYEEEPVSKAVQIQAPFVDTPLHRGPTMNRGLNGNLNSLASVRLLHRANGLSDGYFVNSGRGAIVAGACKASYYDLTKLDLSSTDLHPSKTFELPTEPRILTLSEDGRWAAISRENNWRAIYAVQASEERPYNCTTLQYGAEGSQPAMSFAFSPIGRVLADGGFRGQLSLRSCPGVTIDKLKLPGEGAPPAIGMSAPKELPILWRFETDTSPVLALKFTSDGRYLVAGWGSGMMRVFPVPSRTGRLEPLIELDAGSPVHALAFDAHQTILLFGTENGAISGCSMEKLIRGKPQITRVKEAGGAGIACLSISQDGRLVASGAMGGAEVYSLSEPAGHNRTAWLEIKGEPVQGLQFSPDALRLLVLTPYKALLIGEA